MRHRLEVAQQAIIAATLLFACVFALFALDGDISGKASTGNVGTKVTVMESRPANCTFDVGEGYNVISMPCLTTAVPIANATNGSQVLAMYQYVPGDADRWRVYNPNLPSYVISDLQHMTRRAGYVVIMNESVNVTYEGLKVASTDVPLARGWNLVGYPAFNTTNATAAFASIPITQAVAYDKSAEQFITYPGTLVVLVPGRGYWINVTNASSWTVLS